MRPEKQLLRDQIKENIESSNAIIIANYEKITPAMSWDLQQILKQSEGKFEIVKKRIFLKAAYDCGISYNYHDCKGSIGILFAKGDPFAATKSFCGFVEEQKELLNILAGKIEGKDYTAEEIKTISKLPSKNEMRSQLLGLLEAPMSQTLSVIDSILTSLLHCLDNKAKQSS